MNVSGYSPPIDLPDDYHHDVYFTYRNSSWGWATWRRAWRHFEQDPFTLRELERNAGALKRTTAPAGRDLFYMMRDQLKGDLDSWAIWWAYAIADNDAVSVNPVHSRVRNVGHDGSGTHSPDSTQYDVSLGGPKVESMSFPDAVSVDERINRNYLRAIGGDRWYPLKRRISTLLQRLGLWDYYLEMGSS